jgi:hypothetical protein
MVLATYPDAVPVAVTELKAILHDLACRQAAYRLATAYYDGDHSLVFATTKFRQAFGSLFAAFADNLCASVVDAAADRLQLTGFDQEGASPTIRTNRALSCGLRSGGAWKMAAAG